MCQRYIQKQALLQANNQNKFCGFTGGVWMWDNSVCELVDVNLHGGTSHAIVTDNKAKIKLVVSSAFSTPHTSHYTCTKDT